MKKWIIFILCVALLSGSVSAVTVPALLEKRMSDAWIRVYIHWMTYEEQGKLDNKPEYIIGDVTIDGTVDSKDALFTLIYAVGNNPYTTNLPQQHAYHRTRMEDYFIKYIADNTERLFFYIYYFNSAILADVNDDCTPDSQDALQILQYVVGKRKSFIRTDMQENQNHMFYVPWIDEWSPGMIYPFPASRYENLNWPPEE